MIARTLHPLVQLRPRDDIIYVSQNRTVLATELNGFITEGPERGLFFHQTRLLSRYRYLIDDKPPLPVALSNVDQHSWLGYYIALSPNASEQGDWETLGPGGKLAQRANRVACLTFYRRWDARGLGAYKLHARESDVHVGC